MLLRALIFLFFFFPQVGVAEIIPFIGPSLELETVPTNPRPGETVVVRAARSAGSGTPTYVWSVDGRLVDQGVGRDRITVTVGDAGSVTQVTVVLSEGGSVIGQQILDIRPASIDLVWEGNTYTPPFYSGRPLANGSSSITVLAVPNVVQNGSRVDASELVYTWHVNNGVTPVKTGYGASFITLTTPQFENEFTVSVTAKTRDGGVETRGNVSIKPVRPDIVVYEKAPLLGIRFDQVITDSFLLSEGEATFVAFPLFVSSLNTPLYRWMVDNKEVAGTGAQKRNITLRPVDEGGGTFLINFLLENDLKIFERAETNFYFSL
ncbi:MAG: hypothetical protein AAB439_00425 [Patescibacteria group bacterium]